MTRSLRDEHRERTRQTILDAAAQRFAAVGFTAANLDDVAEQAHVTKGALYYHFKNKREIFAAVYQAQAAALAESIQDAMATASDPVSRMRAAAEAFFASTRDDTTRRLMFFEGPSVLGGTDCRQIDKERFLGILHAIVTDLQAIGVAPELDAELLSRLVLALLIEATHELGATDDPAALRTRLEAIAIRAVRGFGNP